MPMPLKNGFLLLLAVTFGASCSGENQRANASVPQAPVALELKIPATFRFVAYGDTRFHDPRDMQAANPAIRKALVAAIDKENPAFISIGGDIVYNGENPKDWQVWDSETAVWREHKIPVFPALGNHDLEGNESRALGNYFAHFPEIQNSRYYSVRTENTLMLVLDSSLDENAGPQGEWLRTQLDHLPDSADFVFLVFHHPPYTSSTGHSIFREGHSARTSEQVLAKALEERQQHTRARFIFFNGHVHNYERHQHGGITYFVTGGGGAHPYLVVRRPDDLYKDPGVNYHYLLAAVDHNRLTVTMHKVSIENGKEIWSQPDSVTIVAPAAVPVTTH